MIEHQSKVDSNMPYRMLNYCIELMRDIIENDQKEIYPTIVPVVLYTGERKWTAINNFSQKQILSKEEYEEYKINMEYKVVDINQITDNELLIKQTYTASLMLIEKSRSKEKAVENIKRIIENTKDIRQLAKLREYIVIIQKGALLENEDEILEMISRKVGNDGMSTLAERWKRENEIIREEARQKALKEARAEALKKIMKAKAEARAEAEKEKIRIENYMLTKLLNVITKMLKNGETDEKIKMYTEATNEQIKQMKEQLGMV